MLKIITKITEFCSIKFFKTFIGNNIKLCCMNLWAMVDIGRTKRLSVFRLEFWHRHRSFLYDRQLTAVWLPASAETVPSSVGFSASVFAIHIHLMAGSDPLDWMVLLSGPVLVSYSFWYFFWTREIDTLELILPTVICWRFEPYVFVPGQIPTNPSYEETTIFFLICTGTISAGITYSPDEPYSKNIFHNSRLLSILLVSISIRLLIRLSILSVVSNRPGLRYRCIASTYISNIDTTLNLNFEFLHRFNRFSFFF